MAANLTPQYHEAEAHYRAARTLEEQLAALEEMWRELPKHKSTEKLQADLKRKLSAIRQDIQQATRRGAGSSKTDPFAIPRSGAGQVALLGTPNVGKSSILARLTNAHVVVADYPFSTAIPVPGMMRFEDIQIELIDTPPITADHVPTGFPGLWRSADALLVVVDLSSESLLEDVEICLRHLAERHVRLTHGPRTHPEEPGGDLLVPGLVLANKRDVAGAEDSLTLLREQLSGRADALPICALEQPGLAELPRRVFDLLRVIRVYAKPPGRKPDLEEPFILPEGSDIHRLAHKIHRDLAHRVRSARIWVNGDPNGHNVQLDHVLQDRDLVELHI